MMNPKNWNRFAKRMFGHSSCLTWDQMAAYTQNRLSEKERNRIEQHLVDCTLCATSIQSITAIRNEKQYIKLFRRTHSTLHEQLIYPEIKRSRKIHCLLVAAVLCFVLAPTLYFLFKTPTHEKIYYQFMKPYSASVRITRGEESIEPFKKAMIYYQKEDYDRAYKMLNSLKSADSTEVEIHFYQGIIQLFRNKPQEAILHFLKVIDDENNGFHNSAKWYLGLAYLRLNNRDQAMNMFNTIVSTQGQYRQSCQEILHRLGQ